MGKIGRVVDRQWEGKTMGTVGRVVDGQWEGSQTKTREKAKQSRRKTKRRKQEEDKEKKQEEDKEKTSDAVTDRCATRVVCCACLELFVAHPPQIVCHARASTSFAREKPS